MASIADALSSLGFQEPQQQIAFVQLVAFCDQKREFIPEGRLGQSAARVILTRSQFNDSVAALDWVRDVTQHLFYTKIDYSRLAARGGFYGQNRDTILSMLDTLGLVQERKATQQHYDVALLFGGGEYQTRMRMQHLVKLLGENAVKPKNIVLLGSTRLLMPELERKSIVQICESRSLGRKK